MEKAMKLQEQLDALQKKMHAEVEACDASANKQKNVVFAARRAAINKFIANGDLPTTFWADAVINALRCEATASDFTPNYLGPYDEALLKTFLQDVSVQYTESGHKITLFFSENPYFEEKELWAECVDVLHADGEAQAEEDMDDGSERWVFSGVAWKAGYGPPSDSEEDSDEEMEEDEAEDAEVKKKRRVESTSAREARLRQQKRGREGERDGKDISPVKGPSVVEVFGFMPPHPEEDELMEEEEDDVVAEAASEWEEEMEDRKLLLRMLEFRVHHDPLTAVMKKAVHMPSMVAAAAADSTSKKPKTE